MSKILSIRISANEWDRLVALTYGNNTTGYENVAEWVRMQIAREWAKHTGKPYNETEVRTSMRLGRPSKTLS